MKNQIKLAIAIAAITSGSALTSKAGLVENGEMFRGSYEIVTKTAECGYKKITNGVLGKVEVIASAEELMIQSAQESYNVAGGNDIFFDLRIQTKMPYVNTQYVSSTRIESNLQFSTQDDSTLKQATTILDVKENGYLKLTRTQSFGLKSLMCEYLRIN